MQIERTIKGCRPGPMATLSGALFLWLLLAVPTLAETAAVHDHADIRAAAEAQARSDSLTPGGRIEVVASQIDARVRLAQCGEALKTSIPYGKKSAARVTVEVRCEAPKPWKLYVPVRRVIFQQVIVAARPLTRGSILTPGDIILTEYDTSRLQKGYILTNEHAIGQKLRRAVKTGDPITPGLLDTPVMVKRGQKVSLVARSGALTVRMAGIAKADGILGQVVEFENQNSKRLVQAIIRSPQSAEILQR